MKMMKFILYSVVSALLFYSFAYGGPSGKPLPPVEVRIVPVQTGMTGGQIKPGDIVEFKILAVSFANAQEMSIEVDLIGGAKLISGETSWKGPAPKNEEKTILLTVQAPERGRGRIRARVSLPTSDSTKFSSEAQFILGVEAKAKPAQEPVVKKDRRGRRIVEYR
jgi:hypothetical protein